MRNMLQNIKRWGWKWNRNGGGVGGVTAKRTWSRTCCSPCIFWRSFRALSALVFSSSALMACQTLEKWRTQLPCDLLRKRRSLLTPEILKPGVCFSVCRSPPVVLLSPGKTETFCSWMWQHHQNFPFHRWKHLNSTLLSSSDTPASFSGASLGLLLSWFNWNWNEAKRKVLTCAIEPTTGQTSRLLHYNVGQKKM